MCRDCSGLARALGSGLRASGGLEEQGFIIVWEFDPEEGRDPENMS